MGRQGIGAARKPVDLEPCLESRFFALSVATISGYTQGMKTAVSIPDELYREADRLARQKKKSRSRLFSDALREYMARHAPDEVTEQMNRACDAIGETRDPFVSAAARRILERSEW
jgi:metal-responsive CopG/Arc/MetJ family transcriptional regulator